MKLSWIRVDPEFNDDDLIRNRRGEDSEIQEGESM